MCLKQSSENRSSAILSALPRFHPLSFARAPSGYVYMANGVSPVHKWNGVSRTAKLAGVPAPSQALVIEGRNAGTISGRYTAYQRWLDIDGNPSNLSPISNEISVTSVGAIRYTNIEASTDSRVHTLQIIRNTSGQNDVYYVDVETTNLCGTEFTSTRDDDNLSAQVSVALFDTENVALANRFAIPPSDKPIVLYYSNRLFFLGEARYEDGHVEVTKGSKTIIGVATQWNSALEGRLLYIPQEDRAYEIDTVDSETQITLVDDFGGATNSFRTYVIRPVPGRRTQVQFSEAGRFDAVPAVNGFEISSSDDLEDEIVGGFVAQSFAYIVERRHIYRLSFLNDPLTDGGVFLAARRGCVNDRCWVNVDGWTYLLDERGIYRFNGGDETEDLSSPIHDLFFLDKQADELRINWRARKLFYATHDRTNATIRWFLSFSGKYLPRHALCFNYQIPQWWIEEYPWPVGCGAEMRTETPHALVCGTARKIFALGQGTLDVVDASEGDTRGTVASATLDSLTLDSNLTLPVSGLVGAPVAIVDHRGKRQVRIIASVSGNTLRITQPWSVIPDTTSIVQIGGITWKWKSGWVRWVFLEHNQTRRVTCSFRPVTGSNEMDLRIFRDYSDTPENSSINWPRITAEESGLRMEKDSPDYEIDLAQKQGFAWLRLDDWTELSAWRPDVVAIELRGYSGTDRVKIHEAAIEGATQ